MATVVEAARRATRWHIGAAVLFIVLGVFAIVEPTVAAIGIAVLVGWLLMFGAAAHVLGTFKGGGLGRVLFQLLSAIVFAVAGLYMLTHPLLAVGTLTAVLAAAIVAAGVFEIISYFRLQTTQASAWILLNGIVALLVGGMIWIKWPSSSLWAIGTLVGANLLVTGVTRLIYALAAREVLG